MRQTHTAAAAAAAAAVGAVGGAWCVVGGGWPWVDVFKLCGEYSNAHTLL